MSTPNQSAERRSPRFVFRAVAIWGFHAVVLLGFAILARQCYAFRPWAVMPLLPMLGVVLAAATGVIRGRALARWSLALFVVSLALPAIQLASDLAFGYAAFALSFFGIGLFVDWGSSGEHFWYPIACTSGAVVNLLFPAGYLSLLLGRLGSASRCAATGLLLSWFVTLTLVLSTELNGVYVGHGLWVASLMALSLGSMQTLAESKKTARESVTPPDDTVRAKRKLGWATAVGLCLLVPAVVTVWRAVQQASERRHEAAILSENNARIAAEVERLVVEHLSNLPDDDPIVERYGRFVAFTGSGHQQHQGFIRSPFVCMVRRAVFEQAEVRCTIDVSARGLLQIETRMLPTPEWLAENPHVQLVKQGSEFKSVSENMVGSTSLEVFVRHPEYFTSLQARGRTNQVRNEVDSVLEQLRQRRPDDSQSSSAGPKQWIAGTMDSESISTLLDRALQHDDVDVKVRAIALMRTPQGTSSQIAFSNLVIEQLLAVVADDGAHVRVRQEAVRTLMHLYESDRRKLYATLNELGPAASFAVQPIVEFVSDRSQRHWTVGGAFDAPVGAVELLGTWGAESAEAVPILTAIVEGEHPNGWSLAPAAAEALGAIGPAAASAIPSLRLATSSRRSNVGNAARSALEKLRPYDVADQPDSQPLKLDHEDAADKLYPFQPTAASICPSVDGSMLWLVHLRRPQGSLLRIDVETGDCHHVLDFASQQVCSAQVDGEHLHLLTKEKTDVGISLGVESWHLAERRSIENRTIYEIAALDPPREPGIEDIVWSPKRSLVAFSESIRTPHGKGYTVSKRIRVVGLDGKRTSLPDRVPEYLMKPFAFSSSGRELYVQGFCFAAGTDCVAAMDIESGEIRVLGRDAGMPLPYLARDATSDWITFPDRGGGNQNVNVVRVETGERYTVAFDPRPTYLSHPWRVASVIDPDRRRLCVATEWSLDVYDLETGHRVARDAVFLHDGADRIRPLMMLSIDGQFVCLAMTGRNDKELWIRRVPQENRCPIQTAASFD